MAKRTTSRGIRNNNPLNIRIGNVWLGEVKEPTDKQFEQFVSMEYGLRAAFVLLRRYIKHYKRTTIAEIISAWAPMSENDTEWYINQVSKMTHKDPHQTIAYEDKATMISLVQAMGYVECGCLINENLINKGYSIA